MIRVRRVVAVAIIIVIPLSVLLLPSFLKENAEILFLNTFSPVMKVSRVMRSGTDRFFRGIIDLFKAKDENRRLLLENRKLSTENLHLKEAQKENARLHRLLSFDETKVEFSTPARIVGRDSGRWYHTVLIDKGFSNGVREGMCVVSGADLVGKVIQIGNKVSKVLLIIDHHSRVGAIVQRSRENGVLEGRSQLLCRLNYLSRNADIKEGDLIISSGLTQGFPKGLAIGNVMNVHKEKYGLYSYADIKPAVDFGKIEEVLVIDHGLEKSESL
ncbi:MAG: rod shape-determining protein MreC [Candidatus Theseobacter exili]|nr:rod shape-determining protein MreC [Candidatus Theseobacter exili]